MSVDLTIVIPTFNERDNITPMIEALETALSGVAWEVIFIDDDSPDGTAQVVKENALNDPRVRCIHRIGRRGLSSACIEGLMASPAPFMAVMDADFQHDESKLPEMLQCIKEGGHDIVIGSRYIGDGSTGDWAERRVKISRLATFIGGLVLKTKVSDPMSGFFMLNREFLRGVVGHLSGKGFKILLDMLASSPIPPKVAEIPFQFRVRRVGESKLDSVVVLEYLELVLEKLLGHIIPLRFLMFVAVGSIGAVLHLVSLKFALDYFLVSFVWAQSFATFSAMTLNFILNNFFTYRDRRLHGIKMLQGLVSFYMTCALGALISVGLGDFLFEKGVTWWLSGFLGAVVGSVWNFAITSVFTWRKTN